MYAKVEERFTSFGTMAQTPKTVDPPEEQAFEVVNVSLHSELKYLFIIYVLVSSSMYLSSMC